MIKRSFFFLINLILTLVLLICLNSILYRTPIHEAGPKEKFIIKDFTLADSIRYLPLLKKWGKYKNLLKGFEVQTLIALSYYPELENVPITFEVKEAVFPLSSRPRPISLILPGITRRYKITISNKSLKEYDLILLNKLPFN